MKRMLCSLLGATLPSGSVGSRNTRFQAACWHYLGRTFTD